MTKSILTRGQGKKLETVGNVFIEFPSGKSCDRVKIGADKLFMLYSPSLDGTSIKNISTRLRDYLDFCRWYIVNNYNSCVVRINDENLNNYSNYLKTKLNNGENTILVKISHIRAISKYAEECLGVGRGWTYKVRGKPFQKKDSLGTSQNGSEVMRTTINRIKIKDLLYSLENKDWEELRLLIITVIVYGLK